MKAVLNLILLLLLNACFGQGPVISNEAQNLFYIGLDNPISFAIPNVAPENTLIQTDMGEIIKMDSQYYWSLFDSFRGTEYPKNRVHPGNAGLYLYEIKNSDTILRYSKECRIRRMPKPEIRIGALSPGQISLLALKFQPTVNLVLRNFIVSGVRCRIKSYRMTLISTQFGIRKFDVEGSSFIMARSYLNKVRTDLIVIIDEVRYTFDKISESENNTLDHSTVFVYSKNRNLYLKVSTNTFYYPFDRMDVSFLNMGDSFELGHFNNGHLKPSIILHNYEPILTLKDNDTILSKMNANTFKVKNGNITGIGNLAYKLKDSLYPNEKQILINASDTLSFFFKFFDNLKSRPIGHWKFYRNDTLIVSAKIKSQNFKHYYSSDVQVCGTHYEPEPYPWFLEVKDFWCDFNFQKELKHYKYLPPNWYKKQKE